MHPSVSPSVVLFHNWCDYYNDHTREKQGCGEIPLETIGMGHQIGPQSMDLFPQVRLKALK